MSTVGAIGTGAAAHRGSRRRLLASRLQGDLTAAHGAMVATLKAAALKSFERKLLGLVKGLKEPNDPLPEEPASKALR